MEGGKEVNLFPTRLFQQLRISRERARRDRGEMALRGLREFLEH